AVDIRQPAAEAAHARVQRGEHGAAGRVDLEDLAVEVRVEQGTEVGRPGQPADQVGRDVERGHRRVRRRVPHQDLVEVGALEVDPAVEVSQPGDVGRRGGVDDVRAEHGAGVGVERVE